MPVQSRQVCAGCVSASLPTLWPMSGDDAPVGAAEAI